MFLQQHNNKIFKQLSQLQHFLANSILALTHNRTFKCLSILVFAMQSLVIAANFTQRHRFKLLVFKFKDFLTQYSRSYEKSCRMQHKMMN